jgi:hypothetical protein
MADFSGLVFEIYIQHALNFFEPSNLKAAQIVGAHTFYKSIHELIV